MKKQEMSGKIGILSTFAYAFGCAVGWGAFMMPSNIFLPEAGPLYQHGRFSLLIYLLYGLTLQL